MLNARIYTKTQKQQTQFLSLLNFLRISIHNPRFHLITQNKKHPWFGYVETPTLLCKTAVRPDQASEQQKAQRCRRFSLTKCRYRLMISDFLGAIALTSLRSNKANVCRVFHVLCERIKRSGQDDKGILGHPPVSRHVTKGPQE